MIKTAETYHVPVLLNESIEGLNIHPNGVYVDVTFGGGGHSREILSRLKEGCSLYSFDQDADAELNISKMGLNNDQTDRFTFIRSNFRYLKNWMRYYNIDHIDGLLADLGVSSHHFDDETRGFSFRMDALREMLLAATDLLSPGGRLSVITYHSLEDRMVKNIMKSGNIEGKVKQDFYGKRETPFKLINNKVITASNAEQEQNPRSRSAKLRIAEKKAND